MIIDQIEIEGNSRSKELNKRIVLAPNEESIVYEEYYDGDIERASIKILYQKICEKKYVIAE
jgi:hypothetical protein